MSDLTLRQTGLDSVPLLQQRVVGPILILAGLLGPGRLPGASLADFTTRQFSGAGNCAFCHDPWTPEDTESGAELATDWRATMMAHSFKDPLWRAVMEREVKEHPGLQSFIEDKCQTCHAPLARSQACAEGAEGLAVADALESPLAGEGVGCTLCHQIVHTNLGTPASFTGHYQIATNRLIYGPYKRVLTMPMQRHVDFTPVHGVHTQDSTLCATCHTLFTPILDEEGAVIGEFPEQTPYLEWRNSVFAERGQHCQDCHMPRLDTPVKVSSRPPWLEPRAPFWKHQFVGGNAFMLELFADNPEILQPNANSESLRAMAEQARHQLRRAAELRVVGTREDSAAVIHVTVQNLSGHKFPTGHPYRRAWLHVRLSDDGGRVVFESGATDEAGRLEQVDGGYAPHHDVITHPGDVQIYQSVMADARGKATWSLLRGASYLKDNRIPPKGFAHERARSEVAVWGVKADPNFNTQASARDEVTYRIPVRTPAGTLHAEVVLLYQAVPPEAVAHLIQSREPAAEAFASVFRDRSNRPEVIQRVELKL